MRLPLDEAREVEERLAPVPPQLPDLAREPYSHNNRPCLAGILNAWRSRDWGGADEAVHPRLRYGVRSGVPRLRRGAGSGSAKPEALCLQLGLAWRLSENRAA